MNIYKNKQEMFMLHQQNGKSYKVGNGSTVR